MNGYTGLFGLVTVKVDMSLQVELGGERLVAVVAIVNAAGRIDGVAFPRFAFFRQMRVRRSCIAFVRRVALTGRRQPVYRRHKRDRFDVVMTGIGLRRRFQNDVFCRDSVVVVFVS